MKTVLIVEDEKMIRQGIKTMIMRSGVPIETIMECNNGETALEILKEQEIDVMFTDGAGVRGRRRGAERGRRACAGAEAQTGTDYHRYPHAEDGWHRTGTENAEPRTYSTYRGNQWL